MILEKSQFNEYLGKGKKGWIIYNNYSGAMIEVTEFIYMAIKENKINKIQENEILMDLLRGKFVVEAENNEIEELIKTRDQRREQNRYIGLQLLPTLDCNFSCVYCYEGGGNNGIYMSDDVIKAIIDYTESAIKPTTEYISVSWYGGEPLLAVDPIKKISERLIQISEKKGCRYISSIITNGYLMDEQKINELKRFKIDICQITLDGPRDVHNRMRPLRNGSGTYDIILKNTKYAINAGMDVYIRVGVTRSNVRSLRDLISDLQAHQIIGHVYLKYALIDVFGKTCISMRDDILNTNEAAEILKSYNLVDFKREKMQRDVPRFEGCVANTPSSLIIGPEGELYKCSKTIGERDESCGSIFEVNKNHPNFKKWSLNDRFNDEQCGRCSMVPICAGKGCPYDIIIKGKGKIECDYSNKHKNHIDFLRRLYEDKISRRYQERL